MLVSDLFDGFFKGRKVFVTGHTGFKGAWLSLWLTELGADVSGYALAPSTDPNLFELCGLRNRLSHFEEDVRDYSRLESVLLREKPEVVVHMAAQALVRDSYEDPVGTYETNVMGTTNLLNICRRIDSVKSIVVVTSDKCYKNISKQTGYQESDSLGGDDPYSASKGCQELVLHSYASSFFSPCDYNEHGVAIASVRAGNIFGGGDWAKDRIVPDCIRAFSSGGPVVLRYPRATRPWQFVLEPLYGYLVLAKNLVENGVDFSGAWNFGPSMENAIAVQELVQKMTGFWGDGASFEIDSVSTYKETNYLFLDSSKSNKKLNWSPLYTLDQSLKNTVGWYKDYFEQKNILERSIKTISDYVSVLSAEELV